MQARSTTARRTPIAVRRSRWRPLLLLIALAAVAYAFLGGEDSLYRLWERRQELAEVEAQVARLQAENDSLRNVLHLLETNLEYVEKVAREEYGMSKKGERIYRLRPSEGED